MRTLAQYGALLRYARQMRGWSLRDLAARSGVSAATISRAERGHDFQVSVLIRLMDTLFERLEEGKR